MRVLLVLTGTPDSATRARVGDFAAWFRRAAPGVDWRVAAPFLGEPLPAPDRHAGMVIGGSPASVHDGEPWMGRVGEAARAWAAAGRPVLGVCFGHQLLAVALGGRVGPAPDGGEWGAHRLRREAAGRDDPVFAELPDEFWAAESHGEAVVEPPAGAVRLATRPGGTAWQAMAVGPRIHGVQFHPEIGEAELRAALLSRGVEGAVRGGLEGARVLDRWLRLAGALR